MLKHRALLILILVLLAISLACVLSCARRGDSGSSTILVSGGGDMTCANADDVAQFIVPASQ
jgi:hypothetical protein